MFKLRIVGDLGFEVWQDIPGYEGRYQASTYGRIRNQYRKILKPYMSNNGYYLICLCLNKKSRYLLHRIIGITFLPKWKPEYTQINHKSEVKTENQVWNLEWCTHLYNLRYGTGAYRSIQSRSKQILQLSLEGKLIASHASFAEIERALGFAKGNICKACKGGYKTAYGFKWQYAE